MRLSHNGGPGIFQLFNEEVIQLARISLSAAFIKGRHSQAIRDTGRSTVGTWDGAGCVWGDYDDKLLSRLEEVQKMNRGKKKEIENRKRQNEAAEEKNPVQNSPDSRWQGAAFQAWRFYCAPWQPNQVLRRSVQAEWRCIIASFCNKQ